MARTSDSTDWLDAFGLQPEQEEFLDLIFDMNAVLQETRERVESLTEALTLVQRILAEKVGTSS